MRKTATVSHEETLMALRIACFSVAMLWWGTALAWFDEGHMKVAALAYEQLTAQPDRGATARQGLIDPQRKRVPLAALHDVPRILSSR
jgi:hypothetical protein